MVGVGHFCTDGERSGFRIYLWIGKVNETFVWIYGVVGKRNADGRLPGTCRVLLAESYVTLFTFQIVKCSHAEINQYSIAFYDGGKKRLIAAAYQRSQVDISFTDLSGYRRTYDGISQFLFCLIQISFAHAYAGYCSFISSNGVVQVQLAGCILFIQRTDTVQVTLSLAGCCFVLLQLGTCLVCFGTVFILINDKECLVSFYISSFLEKHLFEETLYAGANFYKLLSTDSAHVFSINFYILLLSRCHANDGKFRFRFFFAGQNQVQSNDNDYADCCIDGLFFFHS